MTPLKPIGKENYTSVEEALSALDKYKPKKTTIRTSPRTQLRTGNESQDFSLENFPEIVRDNPKDYIRLGEKNVVVAKSQKHNDLNWKKAIEKVQEYGLVLPRTDVLTQHYLNLREASEGKVTLYDAAGNPIERDESTEHWNYVSSTDRSPFNGEIFWTWMDALFKKNDQGELYLLTDHRIVNGSLESRSVTLDDYVKVNGKLVDLTFNNQGLPISESSLGQYTQGKNIYFWQPVEGRVAWFDTHSGGSNFYCNGNVVNSYFSLGVLECAEGTQRN